MRVGLYGGMANNMYVFAKAIAEQNNDLIFIRDRSDHYPFSQPIWEDLSFSMGYDEVPRANLWPWTQWDTFEKQLGWKAPQWLFDPLTETGGKASVRSPPSIHFPDRYFFRQYVDTGHRSPVLRKMQSCDGLLVCGVEGSLLAHASGRPYIILPHGGDLMIAAGLLKPKLIHIRSRLLHEMTARQLVTAYANALCIGVHEPSAFSTDFYGAEHFFKKHKICFLAIPIPIRFRSPEKNVRRAALTRLLSELNITSSNSEFIGFIPSRVDYEWKGQDRLLNALVQLKVKGKASNLHLIFSGWGNDFAKAQRFVRDNGLQSQVTFLPCALSKPLLFQFYLSADFVVDQFIVGMTGTSSLEAMACGAPVMMWINQDAERHWGAPPVLQARTTVEIESLLQEISSNKINLDKVGNDLQRWVDRLHNPPNVVRGLVDKLTAC